MVFDKSQLAQTDYSDLYEAVKRTGPKIRFWYSLPNAFLSFINQDSIADRTGATSDYDKLKEGRDWFTPDEYNTLKTRIGVNSLSNGLLGRLGNLIGLKNIDICVHNPQYALPSLDLGKRTAELVQIDALGFGNIYEGRINFERGIAVISEEDQDLAHRLGLMFTPAGILETDALTPSSPDMHKKGLWGEKIVLYCDNRACRKVIRNPVLVVDDRTGGAYHSHICYEKDIGVKRYLGIEGCKPREVSLDEANCMMNDGKLQQSPNFKSQDPKLRSIDSGLEAAVLFAP